MRIHLIIAILLILAGTVVVAARGFTYVTKEKVVDLGPIEVTQEREKTVDWPPVLGIAAIVGGVAILTLSRRG